MSLAGLRVLVVEDQALERPVITEVLHALGVGQVTVAADGHAALALLREASPAVDVLICDLGLPDMDSAELIRRAAEQCLARALILCSAARHPMQHAATAIAAARGLRLLGYIDLPISARDLHSLLELLDPDLPSSANSGA